MTNEENSMRRHGMSHNHQCLDIERIKKWNIQQLDDHMKVKSTHPKRNTEIDIKIQIKAGTETETEIEIDLERGIGIENGIGAEIRIQAAEV